MKKFVIFSLFAFLILAFGTIVYGQEKAPVLEFKASGWLDISSEWKLNVPEAGSGDTANDAFYGPAVAIDYATGLGDYLPGGRNFDKYEAWMRSRGRLKFEAIMGKEMTGTFQFEIDATNWGSADGTRNRAGYWLADRAAVEVKHMYITFGMPWVPIPITIQAGIQPIAVRPNVNLYNDGPGVTVAAKIDPALIKLMWFKQWEGRNAAADDMDIYGLDANFKMETLTVGGYALYYNMNTYPLNVTSLAPLYSSEMWWLGLYTDGKLGPVNLTLDFGLDTGKVKSRADNGPIPKDVDYSGWMFRGEAAFPWEKFTFGGVFSYGSGADVNKTYWNGLPGTFSPNTGAATSKVGAYAFAPGSEGGPGDLFIVNANGSFDRGISGMFGAPGNQMARSCYGGLWYLKLYGAMKVTDMWKATLAGAYVGDTTKNGNTLGDAGKADGTFRDDSYIGIEVDLLNQFQLYKNLTWDVGFGYLFAGKGLDYFDVPASIAAGAVVNKSPKDPYALVTRLVYSF